MIQVGYRIISKAKGASIMDSVYGGGFNAGTTYSSIRAWAWLVDEPLSRTGFRLVSKVDVARSNEDRWSVQNVLCLLIMEMIAVMFVTALCVRFWLDRQLL